MKSIIISLVAGLSTIFGYFFIYVKGSKENIVMKSLSFSASVMLTVSIIDLIPSSFKYLNILNGNFYNILYLIIFILIGFAFCFVLDTYISGDKLYKTGIISTIGLILHNIPEGIITYSISNINIKLGIIFSVAIILHNIPEGISIAMPIYYSTNSKFKAFLYASIAGISEPFGAIAAHLFLKNISILSIGFLLAFVSGIMIYISCIETFSKYNNLYKNYIFLGFLLIIIVEIII